MTSRPLFSIEKDAGSDDLSIFLYFGCGETRIMVADDPKGYREFVKYLQGMTQEIKETYNQI